MARDTKKQILAAAAKVATERGTHALTLDAVAAEAGVSKGGLLYHYRTKEDLLSAMVTAFVGVTEGCIEDSTKADARPGAWPRGFLKACTTGEADSEGSYARLSVAVLAAAANDRSLLAPLSDRQAEWRSALNKCGIEPAIAHIIRLAADGLWINDVLDVPILSDLERQAVLKALVHLSLGQLTEETSQNGRQDER